MSTEAEIVKFFLAHGEEDDAEALTCAKFGIDEETLNYILMCDLVETFSTGQ